MAPFADRRDGGRALAARLAHHAGQSRLVVLGLPRGGVPVAAEVAAGLGAPLDVFVVRKLGTPSQPELAMGAIASGGLRVLNPQVVAHAGVTPEEVEAVAGREAAVLAARERAYRGDRPPLDLRDATVILVDDGLATGATMRAALAAVRQQHPAAVVVAVPVAAPETAAALAPEADEVVAVLLPRRFRAVGLWYANFDPVTDDEVRASLQNLRNPGGTPR